MKLLRGFKTEIRPSNKQRALLLKTAGCARFTYNWGLAQRIKEYTEAKKSSTAIGQHRRLNAIKAEKFPWMYEVTKCAPQEALRDLDGAYVNFYRRVRNGENPGFPTFKSKHNTAPSFRINSKQGITSTHIHLPRIGWVRLKEACYIPTDKSIQKQITIKRSNGGRWFVSVLCEVEESKDANGLEIAPSEPTRVVGVDRGLKEFLVTSDGDRIEHPRLLKKKERRLKIRQRRVSKKKKASSNRKKAAKALAVTHYRIRCARLDFLHKTTTSLVKTKPDAKFVVEDLNIKGMMANHKLAKAIGDSGWGEFSRQLEYKAAEMGDGRFVKADRWFPSTKMCSRCQCIRESVGLDERTFTCPSCKLVLDRDLNAAINLSKYEEYVSRGIWVPRASKNELPPVRRKVTPVQLTSASKGRRGRKKSQVLSTVVDKTW